jgi:hypothetical protein
MRHALTFWSVLSVLAGSSAGVPAQTPPPQHDLLIGRVHDQAGRDLSGVEVVINRREVRATTDRNGVFTILVSPVDSTVGFRRIGYRPILLSLHPLPSLRDTILVELIASAVQLPELIVSAPASKPLRYAGTTKYDDVFRRQKIGLGTLVDRDAIDRRFGSSAAELLQGIPGVRVSNGPPKRISFVRCQNPGGVQVFIDGVRQVPMSGSRDPGNRLENPTLARLSFNETPEVEMLSRINPSDIEMIEVYRGVSEIPGVFHWDGCAVIAVWTKWND